MAVGECLKLIEVIPVLFVIAFASFRFKKMQIPFRFFTSELHIADWRWSWFIANLAQPFYGTLSISHTAFDAEMVQRIKQNTEPFASICEQPSSSSAFFDIGP